MLDSQYFVWEAHPFIFQFSEGIGPRWYGFAYLLGFVVGLWLLQRYSKLGRSPLTKELNVDLVVYLALGVFIGGRLGYFLFYRPSELSNPLVLLKVWEGGMASHGGFIGVAIAALWFARRAKIPFLQLADLAATVTPPGLFFGRVANFINAELWGKTTTVPWAVIFPDSDPHSPIGRVMPRHPSQLYEAGLEGLLLFVYLQFRFWRGRAAAEKPGQITGEFLIGYALVRIFCELFREPDVGVMRVLPQVSNGTFYSLVTAIAGVAFIVVARARAGTQAPAAR